MDDMNKISDQQKTKVSKLSTTLNKLAEEASDAIAEPLRTIIVRRYSGWWSRAAPKSAGHILAVAALMKAAKKKMPKETGEKEERKKTARRIHAAEKEMKKKMRIETKPWHKCSANCQRIAYITPLNLPMFRGA